MSITFHHAFRGRNVEKGLAQAVDAVDGLLQTHLALSAGQANGNELSDCVD